jgi:hypothetical protein
MCHSSVFRFRKNDILTSPWNDRTREWHENREISGKMHDVKPIHVVILQRCLNLHLSTHDKDL